MGQAKQRGNFEQRKHQSIMKAKEDDIISEQKRIERAEQNRQYAIDHPHLVRSQNTKRLIIAALIGMAY